jgi:hypothetical protein
MLRNPVDMMYSLHSQLVYDNDQGLVDFAAIEAEEERWHARRIPRGARPPQALVYRDAARFTDQVGRYRSTFGPPQVRIVLLDDLKTEKLASEVRSLGELVGRDLSAWQETGRG